MVLSDLYIYSSFSLVISILTVFNERKSFKFCEISYIRILHKSAFSRFITKSLKSLLTLVDLVIFLNYF